MLLAPVITVNKQRLKTSNLVKYTLYGSGQRVGLPCFYSPQTPWSILVYQRL